MPELGTEDVLLLTSFGFLHLPKDTDGRPVPPSADRIEDVRDRLRDPAAARDILDLDGLNPRVQDIVLNTPGARELIANLADYAGLPTGPRRIAIGCAGGKHRAVGLAELLARALRDRGRQVEVEHLHVHLPRVLKTPAASPAHTNPEQEPTR
ncbi:RNase adapter RapZ [Streptomyces sp. NPDC001795]|uniref:RapZ C-terminal domain-containing protein n=1 Tax=Streptomyces sp. NPDC001795 TaxID=3154525 RepID=UPI00331C1E41